MVPLLTRLNTTKSPHKAPPGPSRRFLLNALRNWPDNFLPTLLRIPRDYGDVVRMSFGLETRYLINHPDYIKYVAEDNKHNFKKDSEDNDLLKNVIGEGLVTSHGELWYRQRRQSSPAFSRSRLEGYGEKMTAATLEMLEQWKKVAHQGRPININKQMRYLTLNIINQTLFGQTNTRAEIEALEQAYSNINQETTRNPALMAFPHLPTPGNRRLRAAIKTIDEIVDGMIKAARRQAGETNNLLAMLLAPDEKTGLTMDDHSIRDQLRLLLLAGHQTSADTLAWVWYVLDACPHVAERLHAELETVLKGRTPTVTDLPNLIYTRSLVEETLRLYPPIWVVPRLTYTTDTIGGYHIPAGSGVWISPYLMHRHPKFWPDPEDFNPDRFSPEQRQSRPRYAFIPFGIGHRLCLGDNFAMLEMQLVVAAVAQHYRLRLIPGHQFKLKPLLTIHPDAELMMTLQGR